MNSFKNMLTTQKKDSSISSLLSEKTRKTGEFFWFGLSFLLFLALGPFAAPVAVIGVFSLAPKADNTGEPEPVRVRSNDKK